jgi:E3 ubiquitin-protein ligase TRIP12
VEEFPLVSDALPVLSSRLNHDDKKTQDTACTALSRLADSYKHDAKRLALVARSDVLTNLQQLLVTQQVSPHTFTTCLHILVLVASSVPTIAQTLLANDMAKTLHQLLVSTLPREAAGSSKDHDSSFDIIPRSPQVRICNCFNQSDL